MKLIKVAQQKISETEVEACMRRNIDLGLKGKWSPWFSYALYKNITEPKEKATLVEGLQNEAPIAGESHNRYNLLMHYYTKMIERLESNFTTVNQEGEWLHIFIQNRPSHHDKEKYKTHKLYYTIDATEIDDVYRFTVAFPHLKKLIESATSDIEGKLSFKAPSHLEYFMCKNDNLVIHFSNPNARDAVAGAVKSWMSTNKINAGERTHTFGKDEDGTSYGDLIATRTVEDVKKITETGKYTLEQLVPYAVKSFYSRLKDAEGGAAIPEQSSDFTEKTVLDDSLSKFSYFKKDLDELINQYGGLEILQGVENSKSLKYLMDNMYSSVMNIYDIGAKREFSGFFQQIYSKLHYALNGGSVQDIQSNLQALKDGFNQLCQKYRHLGVGFDTEFKNDPKYQEAKKYRSANTRTKIIHIGN